MTTTVDQMAAEYEAARLEGEKRIRGRWKYLGAATRHILERSGFYSERGHRLKPDDVSTGYPGADVERLEYALGLFTLCVSAKIPIRSEAGASIPKEAASDEILTSCEELLFVPAWHDPEFLRLALAAAAVHQQANALMWVGPAPDDKPLATFGGVLLKIGLLLVMPAALAYGLVAALSRELWGAGIAFYVLGAGVLAAISANERAAGKHLAPSERAYVGWSQFRYQHGGGVAGSGASVNLELMARDGIKVPAVVFDLCAMLESRMRTASTDAAQLAVEAGVDRSAA